MKWTIKVDGCFSRLQGNEYSYSKRDDLEKMLEYLHVKNYKGPGEYQIFDSDGKSYTLTVLFENKQSGRDIV